MTVTPTPKNRSIFRHGNCHNQEAVVILIVSLPSLFWFFTTPLFRYLVGLAIHNPLIASLVLTAFSLLQLVRKEGLDMISNHLKLLLENGTVYMRSSSLEALLFFSL
jgi:hypothetical protein